MERDEYLRLIDEIEAAYLDGRLTSYDMEEVVPGNWLDDARRLFSWRSDNWRTANLELARLFSSRINPAAEKV